MVKLTSALARTGRKTRNPVYNWNLETMPWQIQPFCLAPVLPGETMKNIKFQARVVSDPIRNPLIGWHKEYYWFYVKLRDMTGKEDFEDMMLDINKDMGAYNEAASAKYYHAYGINWARRATECVVQEYFRAEEEVIGVSTINGTPGAALNIDDWLSSAVKSTEYDDFNDVDVDLDADDTITVGEMDKARQVYEYARAGGLTDMDFEDYLRTFGIRLPTAEQNRPELLRFSREWTYPTNTIDPVSGAPSSAVVWSIADRADKDRFFKEPGFILGLTVTRPKVYLSNKKGSPAGLLRNAFAWLPAIMRDDPYTSMIHVADANNGPLQNQAGGYWFDMKDYFLYGDQLVNYATSTEKKNMIALPSDQLQKRYPSEAMAKSFFVDSAGTKFLIKEDGRADITILGSLVDTTPPVSRIGV